jgi:hypothetical protein
MFKQLASSEPEVAKSAKQHQYVTHCCNDSIDDLVVVERTVPNLERKTHVRLHELCSCWIAHNV